ncbi:MAG TPA: NDP-sugar synthase [Solirubrobacterales bacterium]|nr:NDP-sugar synthase [Solirubrobacterales bacterium]
MGFRLAGYRFEAARDGDAIALILASGAGTRLRPFTADRPKALLPIMGRPLLARQLRLLRAAGVDRGVAIVSGSQAAAAPSLKAVAGASGFGLEVTRLPETVAPCRWTRVRVPSGPLGLVRRRGIQPLLGRTVVTLNCDLLLHPDWRGVLAAHRARRADLTLAVSDGAWRGIGRAGAVRWGRERDGWLVSQADDPASGRPACQIGLSVAGPRVWRLLPELPFAAYDPWLDELIPTAIARGLRVQLWGCGAYWRDVGTWPRVLQGHLDVLGGAVPDDGAGQATGGPDAVGRVSEGAEVAADATIGPDATVASGAVVGPRAWISTAVVMGGARVGRRARVERSIVLPGATVAPGAIVCDALVAPGAPPVPLEPEPDCEPGGTPLTVMGGER